MSTAADRTFGRAKLYRVYGIRRGEHSETSLGAQSANSEDEARKLILSVAPGARITRIEPVVYESGSGQSKAEANAELQRLRDKARRL